MMHAAIPATANATAPAKTATAAIHPRRTTFAFDESVPTNWAGGAFLTQWLNGYTLILPAGEKYLCRSIRAFADRATEPALRSAVRGFLGQELTHSAQHNRFCKLMESQGYELYSFNRTYNRISYEILEPAFPPKIHLAIAAGIEHINVFIAEVFLGGKLLAGANPGPRDLFEWHFAEEIEHRAVAYDLLQAVSTSYLLRVVGLVLAVLNLFGDNAVATLVLLRQQHELWRWATWREAFRFFFTRERVAFRLIAFLARYCVPGYNPRQLDCDPLATRILSGYATAREG